MEAQHATGDDAEPRNSERQPLRSERDETNQSSD